jgi:transposase-like protein
VRFEPPRCPHDDCPSITSGHRRWCFKGRYPRACDGRTVQRFLCLECHRTFSTQTFRVDYRLKLPRLNLELIGPFVSKVTHRQAARILGCSRKTIAHRLQLLGAHCRDFHRWRLSIARARGGLVGRFQLDELETFEHSRRLSPVTMPVLIERKSYFIVDLKTAPLPCRGRLSEKDRRKKKEREAGWGVRRSGSREAVEKCFDTLARLHVRRGPVLVETDMKPSYRTILTKRFGSRLAHQRHSSKAKRDYSNPLFPINHTLAMMRDGISRLVRRNWGASKLRERLELHTWIWVVWRNYVRGITNESPRVTPARVLGVEKQRWLPSEIGAWRVDLQA